MTITPIETRAYGRRFRSRLEARWAVFFEHLGLRWEYEPEGFEIDGQRYLPDFCVWTPQARPIWYEVKPQHITADPKFEAFQRVLNGGSDWETLTRCHLLSGDPLAVLDEHDMCPRCGLPLSRENVSRYSDSSLFFCEPCDWETPGGGGHPVQYDGFLGAAYETSKGFIHVDTVEQRCLDRRIGAAAAAAMSARFEHGEAP